MPTIWQPPGIGRSSTVNHPKAVAERLAERERDARLARYEKALQEETENA
jgi:hypothetical protein